MTDPVKVGVAQPITSMDNLCPLCGGKGLLKIRQGMALMSEGSVRGPDTWMVCICCNGTGGRTKNENPKARN